jgi:hypothetical protein
VFPEKKTLVYINYTIIKEEIKPSVPCSVSQKATAYKHELANRLTPRSRDILEKLTGLQLVKKVPAFYET